LVAASANDKLIVTTRRSASDAELYRDGSSLATKSGAVTASSFNVNLFVLARSLMGGPPTQFMNAGISISSVASGLTGVEVTALTNAVNAFQTALGRNV